ncbi:MAG: hypothetical protein JNM18_01575 [Planctomycetaceae bacterium]|nr:hypothetical protein [Planctomycetaceae bacterium]
MFAYRWIVGIALLVPLGLVGCATPSPPANTALVATTPRTYGTSQIVVKHGTPNPRVDRLTRIVDWPRRTFRKDSPDPREVSADTIERLVRYLEQNQLTDVTVYVNHYDPQEMWYRLMHNERVGAGWRYTAGRASLLSYRLLPPAAFARTEYDPYTNSLYLNSNALVHAVSAAAVAKELHESDRPGTTYAVTRAPGFAFLHARRNFREVVEYAKTADQWDLEQQAYRELCPRVGSESVHIGTFFVAWWGGLALKAAGTAGGYAVGRGLEAQRLAEREAQAASLPIATDSPSTIDSLPVQPVLPVAYESAVTLQSVGEYFSHEEWEPPVFVRE